MKCQGNQYNYRLASLAVSMILSLCWLSVSLPFVNAARYDIEQTAARKKNNLNGNPYNPPGNSTEEKNPAGNSTIAEEFLHEFDIASSPCPDVVDYNKCTHPALYIAFHGELVSPPPET